MSSDNQGFTIHLVEEEHLQQADISWAGELKYSESLQASEPGNKHWPYRSSGLKYELENFNYLNVAFISYKLTMYE